MMDPSVFLAFRALADTAVRPDLRSLLPRAITAIFEAARGHVLKTGGDDTWLGVMHVEPGVAIDVAKYVVWNAAMPMACSIITRPDVLTKVPTGPLYARHTKALFRHAEHLIRDAEPRDIIVFDPAVMNQMYKAEVRVDKDTDAVVKAMTELMFGRSGRGDLRYRAFQNPSDAAGDVISRLYKRPAAVELFTSHLSTFDPPLPLMIDHSLNLNVRSGSGGGGVPPPFDDPPPPPPPPEPPRPEPDHPPADEEERRINVWIEEHRHRRDPPLVPGEPYTLACNVAAPRDDSLTGDADVAIRPGDVPPGGLQTEWVLASESVEFEAVDDAVNDAVLIETGTDGDSPWWTATFQLLIPESGSSDTRRVRIRPRDIGKGRVVFAVFALRADAPPRLYRRFSIRLEIETPAETMPLRDDHIAIRARDVLDTAPLDWDAATSLLSIVPTERIAVLTGNIGGDPVRARVEFRIKSGNTVADPIKNVRNAAERLRVEFESDFDAIDPQDLVTRLADFAPMSSAADAAQLATGAARARLDRVLGSPEVFALADAGYALYEAIFDPGSELRKHVDALQPGDRLEISWPEEEAPVAGIPWGLMYCLPPQTPVDPAAFLAFRNRITYDAHPIRDSARALGAPQESILNFGLYWGDANEAIGEEAAWQRTQWASPLHVILPTGTPPRESIVRWFGSPDLATPIMYFYCKTGMVENEAALLFSGSDGVIRQADIGAAPFGSRPLVFANACATSAGDPYVSNAIEQRFFRRGCRAYIGTECRVPIRLASRVAHVFLHLFERKADPRPVPAGEALFQTRLFLLRHFGNLGGIFYSVINLSAVCLASKDELSKKAS